jgi:transposase
VRHNRDLCAGLFEPLLVVRRVLREQIAVLHRRLLAIVRNDEVCRRLMTTPGVGPVVALTYRATIDVPARFRNSRAVGAVMGLTPCKYQSVESDWPPPCRCQGLRQTLLAFGALVRLCCSIGRWIT